MAGKFSETRFDDPGTLTPPGPVGRLVRLGGGVLCLLGTWSILAARSDLTTLREFPLSMSLWLSAFIVLLVTPPVVNIGLGVKWGNWPRVFVIGTMVSGMALSQMVYGEPWAPALGWFVWGWMLYTLLHLGISFALASILATPGCEMRAIPHLWTLVTGRETREHYCPGLLDNIDRWERRRGEATTAA